MTGNNLRVSTENVQRMVWIDLDPGDREVARKREKGAFRHPDLHGWAMTNRAELVSAALTLIKFWLDGIDPSVSYPQFEHEDAPHIYTGRLSDYGIERAATEQTMGSFERWAEVVGGILEANGIRGFLANRDRLEVEADDELHDAADFLSEWHRAHPEPITAAELHNLCSFGPLKNRLPTELVGSRNLEKDLRYWLRRRKGARLGGYQLVKEDGRHARWYVRRAPESS